MSLSPHDFVFQSFRQQLSRKYAATKRQAKTYVTRLILASAVFGLINFSVQASPNSEFEFAVGHWLGKSEWSRADRFESCMISEHNESDELLIFRLDRSGSLTIAVFEKEWKDASLLSLPVLVLADHDILFSGQGLLYAKDVLVFEIPEPRTSFSTLSNATLLSVTANQLSTVFSLDNSDQAIAFLKECVTNGLSSAQTNYDQQRHSRYTYQ